MATVIKTKNGSGAPLASDLVQGELAIDLTNKRLYTENASGTVIELGTVPSTIDINAGTIDGTVIGGSSAAAGSFTTISASGEIAANGGVAFGDNDKAVFGADSDLQIFHDGSHSYITDVGTGDLRINGASNVDIRDTTGVKMFRGVSGGEAILYHNNDQKLATTSTGIDVTGTVTADGLTVEKGSEGTYATISGDNASGSRGLAFTSSANNASVGAKHTLDALSGNGAIAFATGSTTRALIDYTGDISFYEDTGTTAKFFWDASAESLLIGKTSSSFSTVGVEATGTGKIRATMASDNPISLNRTTTDGDIAIFAKDGATVGSIGAYSGRVYIGTGDTGLQFLDAADNIIPINPSTPANRDAAIDLGTSGVRFKDLYLSGGVYLGGTGAANHLNDYEEGTWTPTVYGTGTAGTASYSQRVGTYTKVGNLVYVQMYVIFSSFTGTSAMRISGLPFTAEAGAYENHVGNIILSNISLPAGTIQVAPRALDGQTFIDIQATLDNAGFTPLLADAAGDMIISITYRST